MESAQTLESLGAARLAPGLPLHFGGLTETLVTRSVTANLFDVLRVRPAVGRFFGPEHDRLGGPSSVVLSHDLWVRRFGSDPRIVGHGFRRLTAGRRFNAGPMATFGFIALAIRAIGVYGTTSFVVAKQIPAIGLRITLGASPTRVLQSVLREALRDIALGVGIGLAGAWALSSALESFVFGIRVTDPHVYAAVDGFLAVVGTAAAFVPAMRAARPDPLVASRRHQA